MRKHWQYLKYVVRHKWFVFVAGLETGAPLWRLLIHDWSKFLPSEWFPYVNNFYLPVQPGEWVEGVCDNSPFAGKVIQTRDAGVPGKVDVYLQSNQWSTPAWLWSFEIQSRKEVGAAFDRAWLHHQHLNPHHWQHWVLREDSGKMLTLEMPEGFVREMVADWMGAGRAITGKWRAALWYEENKAKMELHPDTRRRVEDMLFYTLPAKLTGATS